VPDPGTITTVSGAAIAAYLSKDGLAKLLGPTAEYLGGELKELVQKSQQNVARVFSKAERKCGGKLNQPGKVNPRVFKSIYDEARFCENELLAEYFGGVLASSKTPDGKDDRGVYFSDIVKSSSSFQIRLHYLFYYIMWHLAKGKPLDLNTYEGRSKLDIIVPVSVYATTFNLLPGPEEIQIIAHSLSGLSRGGLIDDGWQFTDPKNLKKKNIDTNEQSFSISPTITGLELFLWVHGKGDKTLNSFLDPNLVEGPDIEIHCLDRAKLKNE